MSTLLRPLRIGPVELANRIVSTAHQTTLVEGGVPSEAFVAYHRARAEGGVGLICVEACAVHPSGELSSHGIRGWDPAVVAPLRAVAEAAHARGGRVFAQLFHGGRENWAGAPRSPVLAPSAVPSQRFHTEPRAASGEEIEAIVEGHSQVAARCREAGLDGVELCASHGYLPAQFMAAATNAREDRWGEPLAYARAALAAARRGAGPRMAVGMRLSADEGTAAGRRLEETVAALRALAGEGLLDYVSLVIGDSSTPLGASYIVPPPPVDRALMRDPGRAVRAALEIPVIVTSRAVDPADAEALIAAGSADAVGMTRALIADPELPRKLAEGREQERILCIGCNQGCIGEAQRVLWPALPERKEAQVPECKCEPGRVAGVTEERECFERGRSRLLGVAQSTSRETEPDQVERELEAIAEPAQDGDHLLELRDHLLPFAALRVTDDQHRKGSRDAVLNSRPAEELKALLEQLGRAVAFA